MGSVMSRKRPSSGTAAALLLGLCYAIGSGPAAVADPSPAPGVDPAILARIRDAAMSSDWAWRHLAELADGIGPRLSGSPQLAAAVSQVAEAMRSLNARVTLQAVRVPHWVRGEEHAELVDYPGRLPGMTQRLH